MNPFTKKSNLINSNGLVLFFLERIGSAFLYAIFLPSFHPDEKSGFPSCQG